MLTSFIPYLVDIYDMNGDQQLAISRKARLQASCQLAQPNERKRVCLPFNHLTCEAKWRIDQQACVENPTKSTHIECRVTVPLADSLCLMLPRKSLDAGKQRYPTTYAIGLYACRAERGHSSLAMLTLSLADLLSIRSRAAQSERPAKTADAATAKMLIAAYIAEFGDGARMDAT